MCVPDSKISGTPDEFVPRGNITSSRAADSGGAVNLN